MNNKRGRKRMKHSSRFIICSDSRDGMPGIFFSCFFFFFSWTWVSSFFFVHSQWSILRFRTIQFNNTTFGKNVHGSTRLADGIIPPLTHLQCLVRVACRDLDGMHRAVTFIALVPSFEDTGGWKDSEDRSIDARFSDAGHVIVQRFVSNRCTSL